VKRREFIAGLGAAAWPLAAWAQQRERVRRVGMITAPSADDPEAPTYVAAFAQGLQERGWTVGGNVQIDYRWGASDADLRRKFAAELVALKPDVILATAGSIVGALQETSRTAPIVFVGVIDPVGGGFVESLARPFVSRSLRSRKVGRRPSGPGSLFSRRPELPACSRVDVSGTSQVPRRSILCLCPVLRPRPNRRSLAHLTVPSMLPPLFQQRRLQRLMNFGALLRGFSTRCLRFKCDVATTPAKLASGWLARLYREGVEPSGPPQKVSDQILVPLFWIYPGAMEVSWRAP
jgi:ABC transporter substrate binding protein